MCKMHGGNEKCTHNFCSVNPKGMKQLGEICHIWKDINKGGSERL
jgi:hypothetical protein